MKVLTTHPIIHYSTQNDLDMIMEQFASIDGKNEVQVKHFQIYANKKGAKLKVNGKWDNKTRTAYARFGAEWERVFAAAYPNYTIASPDGKTRAGAFWDKVKNAWVTAKEMGLVDQGLAALGQQGINVPPVDQNVPPVEETFTDPTPTEVGKHKWYWTFLLVAGVAVVGYVVVKKISK